MATGRLPLTHVERCDHMVSHDIAARGISDPRVLAAMRSVPRHRFVDRAMCEHAYDDRALPIEAHQTISQPYIVALMAEALELGPHDRVLEIGTGSGYGAAVLSKLAAEVWSIERIESLAECARQRLRELDIVNVQVVHADGTLGLPIQAPFDAIVVTAAGPHVPAALQSQLAEGGRLVMPIGSQQGHQTLVRMRRSVDGYTVDDLGGVAFVPLIGEQGWPVD